MNARTVLIARSVSIIGGTAALMAGVTFAALQTNTVTLADNQLNVTNDVLRISNGGSYNTAVTGFNINLVPGVESEKKAFYLQNTSAANLGLTVKLNHAAGGSGVDPSGVHVKFYDKDGTTVLADKTLADLATDQTLAGQLDANGRGNGGVSGTEGNYFVSFKVDPSAMTGGAATLNDIDLDFTGTSL